MIRLRYLMQNSFLNIQHLEKSIIDRNTNIDSISDRRGRTQILVIDDENPVIVKNLKNLGYLVTHKKDLQDISEAKNVYDIVIVDVLKVGNTFSGNSEGAFLAYQIKKINMNRPVFLFTGAPNDVKYNKYYKELDGVYAKNQADDLIEQIGVFVENKIDIIDNWIKQRQKLYEKNVSTNEIAFLEHYYIKAHLKLRPEIYKRAIKIFNKKLIQHTDEIKKIIDITMKILEGAIKSAI